MFDPIINSKLNRLLEEGLCSNPANYGLPVLALTGDTSAMTKENAVSLDYVYGDRSGACTMKWQGSSSLMWPKKNYTIKFDNAFEAVEGWGEENKYCLKANYIDHSHARNVVSAKLWGQIVKSRNYQTNLFDMSKITGLVTTWEGNAVVENGILTNGASIAQTGIACFTGVSFPSGTYDIRFDVCSVSDGIWEQISCGFMKQEHGGDVYYEKVFDLNAMYPSTASDTWVHCEVTDVELTETAGFYLQAWYNPASYRFRNIEIKRSHGVDNILNLPNGGAIDGFPCVITLNGDFHGLYTFNIPKDGWMFGMSDETAQQAIICADVAATNACGFNGLATLDGDFDLEYVSDEDNSDWVLTSLNNLITSVMNSDGTDLDTNVAKYLDWESAIDYFIFTVLIGGSDMVRKNYLLSTYDGTKWFFSAYDMDTTYGIEWDGISFHLASKWPKMTDYNHRVMELIQTYKTDKVKARYAELRNTVLSEDNVCLAFSNYVAGIPTPLLVEDVRKWPTIPSSAISNTAQILNWYRMRVLAMDKDIELL